MTDASDNSLAQSLELVARLVDGAGIGPTVAAVERRLEGETRAELVAEQDLGDELLRGAMAVTRAIGNLYALVHAAGMLAAMRVILDDDETIESLSLGAGASGRPDLVTTKRVANSSSSAGTATTALANVSWSPTSSVWRMTSPAATDACTSSTSPGR